MNTKVNIFYLIYTKYFYIIIEKNIILLFVFEFIDFFSAAWFYYAHQPY